MGKKEELKLSLFQCVIRYVRENHAKAIDNAYEYYWDGHQPAEFMGGVALELAFINFEDWLVCDYKVNKDNETFIDIYIKNSGGLKKEELAILKKLRDSVLSLYEVVSVSKDKGLRLKDLLLGNEVSLRDRILTKGLKKGDIFAARLLDLGRSHIMNVCVYPYAAEQKKKVLDRVKTEFGRFLKNVNPKGTMADYLKHYGDIFNLIWMDFILNPAAHKDA
jgi:hypothetical protein